MQERTTRFGLDPFTGQITALWQGTVIANLRNDLRLVVSADCDLASNKGAGTFFYLDVLRARDFVKLYANPESTQDRLETHLTAVRELAEARNHAFGSVDLRVLAEWVSRGDRSRWARDLPGAHPAELDLLESLAKGTRALLARHNGSNISDEDQTPPSVYITCSNPQQQKKTAAINKKIKEQLLARLQSSRLDHFIFPDVPGATESGYYVPFRSIRSMARTDVCESRIELADFPTKFYPVATCRPILLQALLQRFSTYFMRIGFTDVFKTQQDQVAKATLENIR